MEKEALDVIKEWEKIFSTKKIICKKNFGRNMKCSNCQQKKGKRYCAALSSCICSSCCGLIREEQIISCFANCEYLKKGDEAQMAKDINREISDSFQSIDDDVFQIEAVAEFSMEFEEFFIDEFYDDKDVSDDDIYKALTKLYFYRTNRLEPLTADNRCEELVFEKFEKISAEYDDIAKELQDKVILRILKSIRDCSGGIFGNRNYMEFIYSYFYKDGKWTKMLEEFYDADDEDSMPYA